MKNSFFLAALLFGALSVPAVFAEPAAETSQTSYTDAAVALAQDQSVAPERIYQAVADAVKNDSVAPAEIFTRVVAARETWTAEQVGGIYKAMLMSSPALSSSFVSDVKAFDAAGKLTEVGESAPQGVQLLAALYAAATGSVADTVLTGVLATYNGIPTVTSVASLRDVPVQPVRRPQPVKPTPPAISADN